MKNKNLSIMFTDIKGFTEKTSNQSRIATFDMLKLHKDLLTPIIEEYDGQIIKEIGDAFLVVFESPTNAVLSGIQLQKKLFSHNKKALDHEKLEIRIAINTGEVSIIDNDVYGEAVNIAARLEGIAEPNDVYFTESTYLAMNKSEVPTAEIGYKIFKGIPDKIKIFKVLREGQERKKENSDNISYSRIYKKSEDNNTIRSDNSNFNDKHIERDHTNASYKAKLYFNACVFTGLAIGFLMKNVSFGTITGVGIAFIIKAFIFKFNKGIFEKNIFTGLLLTFGGIGYFLGYKWEGYIVGMAIGAFAKIISHSKYEK